MNKTWPFFTCLTFINAIFYTYIMSNRCTVDYTNYRIKNPGKHLFQLIDFVPENRTQPKVAE